MKLKTKIIIGIIVLTAIAFGVLFVLYSCEKNKVRQMEAENRAQAYRQEKIRIETVYVPQKLQEIEDTPGGKERLSRLGSILWGE